MTKNITSPRYTTRRVGPRQFEVVGLSVVGTIFTGQVFRTSREAAAKAATLNRFMAR